MADAMKRGKRGTKRERRTKLGGSDARRKRNIAAATTTRGIRTIEERVVGPCCLRCCERVAHPLLRRLPWLEGAADSAYSRRATNAEVTRVRRLWYRPACRASNDNNPGVRKNRPEVFRTQQNALRPRHWCGTSRRREGLLPGSVGALYRAPVVADTLNAVDHVAMQGRRRRTCDTGRFSRAAAPDSTA